MSSAMPSTRRNLVLPPDQPLILALWLDQTPLQPGHICLLAGMG